MPLFWYVGTQPFTGSEGTKEGPETGNQDRTEVKSLYRRRAYNKIHSIQEYGGFYTMSSDSF